MGVDPLEYDVAELRELRQEPAARGSDAEVELPYLAGLPESEEARAFVVDWLAELVDAGGFDGAVAALEYYRALRWLSTAARDDLEDHLLAVGHGPGTFADLSRADHMRSLARIARLAELAASTDRDP